MRFIDSYKRLEKLCGEILNDERKVSAYIDEMKNTPRGSYLVTGWDADLKKLKHYRWVRNQIVHEPGRTEENMCRPEDVLWLDNFYSRIMNQSDPLALYYKAAASYPQRKIRSNYEDASKGDIFNQEDISQRGKETLGRLACALAAFFTIIILFLIISQVYLFS